MTFAFDELEARALVDAAGCDEDVVCPEHQLAIARRPRETEALVHESRADTEASRPRLDEEEPELRDRLCLLDAEHAPGALAVDLRDPAALALGIEVCDELRDNVGHQRFERLVPAVLLRIERAVALDDPAHVAWPVRA